jgi:hypothetical protein
MLRNIPNKYMQSALMEEIDAMGFGGTYDFFYLPMDVHNRANVGYAFVNFLYPDDMARFSEAFTDYIFKKHPSIKIARVSPAHIQGLLENLWHLSNRAVTWSRNSQYRPVVKYQGRHRDVCELLVELSNTEAQHQWGAKAFCTKGDETYYPEAGQYSEHVEDNLTRSERELLGDLLPPEDLMGPTFNPNAPEFMPAGHAAVQPHLARESPQAALGPPGLDLGVGFLAAPAQERHRLPLPPGLESQTSDTDDGPLCKRQMGSAAQWLAAGMAERAAKGGASVVPFCDDKPEEGSFTSFTSAKLGLQEAVSELLQQEQQQQRNCAAAQSAGGDSSTRSSRSVTPRSTGTASTGEKAPLDTEACTQVVQTQT